MFKERTLIIISGITSKNNDVLGNEKSSDSYLLNPIVEWVQLTIPKLIIGYLTLAFK